MSLDEKFVKNVSSILASKLEMFVADCKDLIIYDLIDPKDVLNKCGIEYLKKREKKVLINCSEYENTVISINFDLFRDNTDVFKNSFIIYLKLPEDKITKTTNQISYDKRNEFLIENVDITINLEKKSKVQAVNNILEKLGELL